ncbi:DoxX-like family protein [Paenibacillus sp. IB182496]|uniref:DoxX-like family protein n=1 Tax=Paenibacillus sabuli TaxID=2772509 RepID=A0A927BTG6_9BACL|nr:DoxX-like family protein [Paenibacillus sabuli]MBD2845977.1 DoxX-like family protein [Paenibacillus sabuli]
MTANKAIYVELNMRTDLETLWRRTQVPELHASWDLRFSEIVYVPRPDEARPQRFLYRTRIGFGLSIAGTGETRSAGAAAGPRLSTLVFDSDHPWSLIRRGAGYWRYVPHADGTVTFLTRYDYATRFGGVGRCFDRLVFRPLFGWATAWSFDRLRLWLEEDRRPRETLERALLHYGCLLALIGVWIYQGAVPKLLHASGAELELLRDAGMTEQVAVAALRALGGAEALLGLLAWPLRRRKSLYVVQAVLLLLLAAAALTIRPGLAAEPFNPVALTLPLLGLCLAAGLTRLRLPDARRCMRAPRADGRLHHACIVVDGSADHDQAASDPCAADGTGGAS